MSAAVVEQIDGAETATKDGGCVTAQHGGAQDYAPIELVEAAARGDKEAESRLLEQNSGLIRSIVRRFLPRSLPRGIDAEDLYQLGAIGFIKAVRNYDAKYQTALSTYAVPKIIGEMRRFLRDDGLIKISRSIKEAGNKILSARERLRVESGAEPTLSEISAVTGLSPEEIAAADEALYALDSMLCGEDDDFYKEGIDRLPDPNTEGELVEKIALGCAISKLNERERAVLKLRYERAFTQQVTAKLLGISQVQVSRIESRAVQNLRILLAEEE